MSRDHLRLLTDAPLDDLADDRFEFAAAVKGLGRHLAQAWPGSGVGPGCTVLSIEGAWGWGKTSFSQMLCADLLQRVHAETQDASGHREPIVVEYNAWLSGPRDGRHWPALAMRIGEAVVQQAQRRFLQQVQDHDAAQHQRALRLDRSGKVRRLKRVLENIVKAVPFTIGHPDPDKGDAHLQLHLPARAQVLDPRTPWTDWAWQLSQAVPAQHWQPFFGLFNDSPSKLPGRGMSTHQAVDTLVDMGARTAEATLSGSQVKALGAPVSAATKLLAAYRGDGVPAEPESQEFVHALDQLCRVLHADARGWRLIVRIEDVSRLENKRRDALLEALAYLRQLSGCLVLLEIDRREADKVLIESRDGPHGEGRLTKTIDLRSEVPESRWHERVELIRDWLAMHLELPADSDDPKHHDELERWEPTRRAAAGRLAKWCQDHHVSSPRELKRLVHWIQVHSPWLAGHRDLAPDAVLVCAALYGHSAMAMAGPRVLTDLDGRIRVDETLLKLPVQPWDHRPWPDDTNLLNVPEDWLAGQPDDVRALVGALRRFTLVLYLAGPDSDASVSAEKHCWECLAAHLQELRGRNELSASIHRLRSEDRDEHRFRSVLETVHEQLTRAGLEELRYTGSLVEFMGHLDLRPEVVEDSFASILEHWHDGAGLVETAAQRDADEDLDTVLLLLGLLHGSKYPEARRTAPQTQDDDARWRRKVVDRLHAANIPGDPE